MKPKQTVYLGGPMTGLPNYNHEKFMDAAHFLKSVYDVAVHNPAASFGSRKDLPVEKYMRHCYHMIMESDAVVFLDGWQKSSGATQEAYMAQGLLLPIYELTRNWELLQVITKLPDARNVEVKTQPVVR